MKSIDWMYKNRYWVGGGIAVALVGVALYYNRKKISKNITNINTQIMEYAQNKVWDAISQKNIETLHPKIREKAMEFINKAEKAGFKLRVTSALRTYAEQNALYAKGRTAPGGIVTNAKGGQSNHNFGFALDVVPIVGGKADWNSKDWAKIGEIGKSVGFDWGGDWKGFVDKPHFEMNFGNSLATLRQKYDSGQKDGNYVRIV